jgi:hypothetical protein
MRRLMLGLLTGAYLCLALIISLVLWRMGAAPAVGLSAFIGTLALCFAFPRPDRQRLRVRAHPHGRRYGARSPRHPAGPDREDRRPHDRAGRDRRPGRPAPLRRAVDRGPPAGRPDRHHERPAGAPADPPGRRRPRRGSRPDAAIQRHAAGGAGRPGREPGRPLPATDRQPAPAPDRLLRKLLASARRERPGDDARRVSGRRRARRPDDRHRQPAAVPLRADRAPAGQAGPQGRDLLQHLAGQPGRRDLLPAVPGIHAGQQGPGWRGDLRTGPGRLRASRRGGSPPHVAPGQPGLQLQPRQGQRPDWTSRTWPAPTSSS